MNKQTEALKLALEALQVATTPLARDRQEVLRAITAIKEALAHPEQEPVAWMFEFPDKRLAPKFDSAPHCGNWQPLYKGKNT